MRLGIAERPRAGVGSLAVGLAAVAVVFAGGMVGLRVACAVLAFPELLAINRSARVWIRRRP